MRFSGVVVRPLVTWMQKLRGLMGTESTTSAVALMGTRSIHTCWMRYPLDVAMVTSAGEVVVSRRGLRPWGLLGHRQAAFVLERPASNEPWPEEGSRVTVVICFERKGEDDGELDDAITPD